jgi:hypothetical protein
MTTRTTRTRMKAAVVAVAEAEQQPVASMDPAEIADGTVLQIWADLLDESQDAQRALVLHHRRWCARVFFVDHALFGCWLRCMVLPSILLGLLVVLEALLLPLEQVRMLEIVVEVVVVVVVE